MQSTADAWEETFTKWQTANDTSDNMTTTLALPPQGFRLPFSLTPYRVSIITVTALGTLANILVLVGFSFTGRSKMNTSSIYIANHAILELFACANSVLRFALDTAGVFNDYHASYPMEWIMCLLIQTASLITLGSFGGISCVIIITLDRYWKIVHPIHHRKHYRRWMLKVGLILPWLNGFAVKLLPEVLTTRIFKGRCVTNTFWAARVMDDVRLCHVQFI